MLHHKNHQHSTSSHSNPQHHKPDKVPSGPSPGGASTQKRQGFLGKVRERFREKQATEEEIKQLKLNTQREELKTRKRIAVTKRPSRFSMFSNQPQRQPSYRRSSKYSQDNSSFFGNSEGSFLNSDFNPSFDMFTGNSQKRGKNKKSGIEELF